MLEPAVSIGAILDRESQIARMVEPPAVLSAFVEQQTHLQSAISPIMEAFRSHKSLTAEHGLAFSKTIAESIHVSQLDMIPPSVATALSDAFDNHAHELTVAMGRSLEVCIPKYDEMSNNLARALEASLPQLNAISEMVYRLIPCFPSVVGTEDLMPSETVQLDKSVVLAIVTQSGSKVSHSAILARTLGIPSVVGLGDGYCELRDGMILIVDGTAGEVLVEPNEAELREYRTKQEELRLHHESLKGLTGTPAVTKNGVRISVNANIGHPDEAELALQNGADGIGLFRSEFLYMESDSLPSEETQFRAYREVLEKMRGKRVIIRTLDIGADKQVPYLNLPPEANPALGYRAIRICLDRTELFRTQLRALLRAAVFGNLAVMFPMIISPQEVRDAKKMVEQAKIELCKEGITFAPDVQLGVMIETPAAAMLSDELAKEVDFFSIGSNDLTQYTLATDRMNGAISKLYDQRHPAVLKLIELTVKNAKKEGTETGICGESAADPELTEFFLRIGVDELSVTPASVPEVKNTVRGIELP